jgi:membrane associated rhomboid family serine protease
MTEPPRTASGREVSTSPTGAPAAGAAIGRYVGTAALAIVVSLIAALEAARPGSGDVDDPTRWLGWSSYLVTRGEWWRLVTSNLVNPANNGLGGHTSAAAHYALNLLGLVVLGVVLERRVAWRRLSVIGIVSGMAGFGSLVLTHPYERAYDGGTSGIVAGLGEALVVFMWSERHDGKWARVRWLLAASVVLLLFVKSTTWTANVNQVHGVAFITGALLAAVTRLRCARSETDLRLRHRARTNL